MQAETSLSESIESGERGGASSAQPRPGQHRSTNREPDDSRPAKHSTNERQDRDRRREEGDSRRGDRSQRLARDHPPSGRDMKDRTQRDTKEYTQTRRDTKEHREMQRETKDTKDHAASGKEYRSSGGYRSERREPPKDQQRPGKDRGTGARDRRRSDTVHDDEELLARPAGRKSSKDQQPGTSRDQPGSKQGGRSDDREGQVSSRGQQGDDVAVDDTKSGSSASADKPDKNVSSASSRQRLRYKVCYSPNSITPTL